MTRLLSSHHEGTVEVLGMEDLNGLLAKHPAVERRHIKLWLPNGDILTRVLHAAVWNDSETALNTIRARMQRYVDNPSHDRAREVLEKYHYCIIAGIPGIGKTTLAEVLIFEYADLHGYDVVRVYSDLSEIRPVLNPNRKQVFYFDDFLGKTTLDKLHKNEDQRIVEFMMQVMKNTNWRFILTTREYILQFAQERHEVLHHAPIEVAKCIVKMEDYTDLVRARILYNHIYFSDLPASFKLAMVNDDTYLRILRHGNYNPRVIDYMTDPFHVTHVEPSQYVDMFLRNLDNPQNIWRHAFENQLSEAARHLLLAMACLPDEILIADLEEIFHHLYRYRSEKYGFSTSSQDFAKALKELEGNFVKINRIGGNTVIEFHNASVRDFLSYHLSESSEDVADLLATFSRFEQCQWLYRTLRRICPEAIVVHGDALLVCMEAHLDTPTCRAVRFLGIDGDVRGLWHMEPAIETRLDVLMEAAAALPSEKAHAILQRTAGLAVNRITQGSVDDKTAAVLLFDRMRAIGILDELGDKGDALSESLKRVLIDAHTLDDFRAFTFLMDKCPDLASPEIMAEMRARFLTYTMRRSRVKTRTRDTNEPKNEFLTVAIALQYPTYQLPFWSTFLREKDLRPQSDPESKTASEPKDTPDHTEEIAELFRSLRNEIIESSEAT